MLPLATESGAEKMICHTIRKRQPASHAVRAKGFAQIVVAPAGLGKRRPQFRPHQTIAKGQHRAHQPAEHRLGSAHRRQEKRDGDVGANPHHVGDGQGGGLNQAQVAAQTGRGFAGNQSSPAAGSGLAGLIRAAPQLVWLPAPAGAAVFSDQLYPRASAPTHEGRDTAPISLAAAEAVPI